ncbi:38774_t:CDS:2 [Gigaspora margarita]|uniref:38774_t:CDS:1 n=1 Tax=Gigaspora margarita TaxID=4874 RepID=A0ABN7UW56_GIGMA|nr:38774_t:CDS:2 [Gigaspora margarita]
MGKNNNNVDEIKGLKVKEYNKIDEMDTWENIVLFMIMLGIMMGPNVDSYAGLDRGQELGDVDFEDEVHGGLAHVTVNTNTLYNLFV